ncbi:MAG: DMT family transporter [Spirochaetota bacterium]
MKLLTDYNRQNQLRGMAFSATGVFCISFDALLVRLADTGGWNVAFWRGSGIFLSLALVVLIQNRGRVGRVLPLFRGPAGFSSILFGVNSILFVMSVSHTSVANTVIILSAGPFFAAIFSRLFLTEHIPLRTWIAVFAAICGVIIIFSGSLEVNDLSGNLYALLMALIMGGNFTLLRGFPAAERIPLVCLGGGVTAIISIFFAHPFSLDTQSYMALAIMGLFQMPLAQVLLATGTRYIPSPEVSLFMLIESALGPVWVWMVTGEVPPSTAFIGGIIIIPTIIIHSLLNLKKLP